MAATVTTAYGKIKQILDSGQLDKRFGVGNLAIYDNHSDASMIPPCISCDVEDYTTESMGMGGNAVLEEYMIPISIRAHSGYAGQPNIGTDNAITAQLINDFLMAHLDLGNNFRIKTITGNGMRQEFRESATVGAELLVTVRAIDSHEQE